MRIACYASTSQRKPSLKNFSRSSSYWYCWSTDLHNTGDKRVKLTNINGQMIFIQLFMNVGLLVWQKDNITAKFWSHNQVFYRMEKRMWGSNKYNDEFPNFTCRRRFTDHQKYTKVVQIHKFGADIEVKYFYLQTHDKTFTRSL